jgi:hypothetical protein
MLPPWPSSMLRSSSRSFARTTTDTGETFCFPGVSAVPNPRLLAAVPSTGKTHVFENSGATAARFAQVLIPFRPHPMTADLRVLA